MQSLKKIHAWAQMQDPILKGCVCFNIEETTSSKGQLFKGKNMLPIGSILFSLKVAPMRTESNLKGIKLERNCQN